MDNSTEKRWLSYYRKGGSKDQHKENRLSKDSIGGPMKLEKNGRFSNIFEPANVPGVSSAHPPSMMMKCIIVHPDKMGYGFTVSGENPVLIQSVKEGGSAARAGVVEGDRILKVNSDSVKNLNHIDVVKLIKEKKSYVALTLLGDTMKSAESSTEHSHLIYDEKIETIKLMLEKEKNEVERIKDKFANHPDPKILKDLNAAEKVKQDLEKQLWKAESMKERLAEQASSASVTSSTNELDVTGSSDALAGDTSSTNTTEDMIEEGSSADRGSQGVTRLRRPPVPIDSGDPQDATMVTANEDNSTIDRTSISMPHNPADFGFDTSKWNTPSSHQNTDILNFEDDDDILAECGSDHGPFGNFDTLRQRPAYLAVFMNFVIESKDPANFLLCMAVESYKMLSSAKEMVKHGEVIYKTYLAPDCALKVDVNGGISRSIHTVLVSKSPSEEALRVVFDPAVQVALKEVRNQLSMFRLKREQGVGNMYGEDVVLEALCGKSNVQSDQKLVDEVLAPTLTKLQHTTSLDPADQTKISIKIDAVQGFLTTYGSKRVKKASRIYSRIRNRPTNISKSRISGSMDSIIDEKDKRLSGIGQIFGGKKIEKNKSKLEKPKANERGGSKKEKPNRASRRHTIRDNPPPLFHTSYFKPSRVGSSISSDQLSSMATTGGSGEAVTSPHDPYMQRPKSVPFEASLRTIETHSVTMHPPPELREAPFSSYTNLSSSGNHGDENADGSDNDLLNATNVLTRSGSFRRNGDQQKHGKSHSDPDKNKVEQAILQQNSQVDQSDSTSLFSFTDSSHSGVPEERRSTVQLPSIADEEIDIDVQQWSDCVPKSVAKGLEKKEIRRQQVIDELISTEQHHVRNLKILEKLFYEPLLNNAYLTREEINQAFSNLKDILQLHRELNRWLQELKEADGHVVKNIGDVLLARFDGKAGDIFKNECATFCGNQFTVLSLIKEKSKKDQKFNDFLEATQKHPIARKLHLKDFIPMEFQRLTKYPLLLDNIIKHTKKKQEAEIKKVKTASERCREILTFVNQTVKQAEDKQIIIEIQKNLDKDPVMKLKSGSETLNEFKNIDLTERTIIHQGALTWRIGQADKRKQISIHCILYDDVFVLLQKQEDRYILRCQEATGGVHDPFISMQRAHVSTVATDKRAFFVVSYVSAQMYEFVATSTSQTKEWINIISQTAKSGTPASTMMRRRPAVSIPVPAASTEENETPHFEKSENSPSAGDLVGRGEENHPDILHDVEEHDEFESNFPPVTSYSTPSPKLLRNRILKKQEEITEALAAKHRLLAEISSLEDNNLEEMLDMCAADDEPDPVTLVRHAVLCADRLAGIINTTTTVDNTFAKRRQQDPTKRFSSYSQADDFPERNPEKWAMKLPHPTQTLSPEKSPLMESSSGTLNSVSDIPLSESDPTLSLNSDNVTSKLSSSLTADSLKLGSTDPILEPPLSPMFDQLSTSSPSHKISDSLPLAAYQSRTGSDPSSSSHSRPSSGVELWVPSTDVPIDRMLGTVMLLQTQLTRLMHVTEENEKERNVLISENQRLKQEIENSENPTREDSPPPYEDSVQ